MSGWIKLHRSLSGSEIARHPEYLAVWVHLLLKAQHSDYTAVVGRSAVDLKAGQLVFGRVKFSLETGVSENKVRAALDVMKTLNMITIKSHAKFSIISITKWHDYQSSSPANNQETASKSPANRQQIATNNNVNNGENEKNDLLKDITPTAKPSAKSKLDYSCWPSMPSDQVLSDYLALRKSKRAAMSQTVINRLAKEFNLAAQYGVTVDQCLEMAVARGWQSFQWDWYQNSTRQQSGGKSQINLNETGWLHGTTDQQSVFGIGGNISGVAKCLPEPARISGGQKAMAGSFGGEPDHDFGAIEPWHQEGSEP